MIFLLCVVWGVKAHQPEFSTAGFFSLKGTGRVVRSMNPAWRFYKGAVADGARFDLDDRNWQVVSLPNGIEYLPVEASGCVNYQGEVWYRKHFVADPKLADQKVFLHFEAIMGKSRVYVNGTLLKEHFGGYLPVVVDATPYLKWGEENVVAVWCDNSDDGSYPPGKPQEVLDFTYFGGIYRDCWMVTHRPIYITDPNYEDQEAGGGLLVSYGAVSIKEAEVNLRLHVRNETQRPFCGIIEYTLLDTEGNQVAQVNSKFRVKACRATTVSDQMKVQHPQLWSPSSPTLYQLEVRIRDEQGTVVDGYRRRIGIRSFEFRAQNGFWLNGEPYEKPVIGVNRHQDFALVGNAVPNSLHWRDAKKLKDLGLDAVRNAHCPQDPAFMDACDELGLLVIVNTPGWQYWNEDPIFAARVYDDIRNIVRRDRNHPCVWMWEPVLNETWYPKDFAQKVRQVVDREYPYPYSYCATDGEALGHEYFPIYFGHPLQMQDAASEIDRSKSYFTREWGDHVDDWLSHNSPSRVARNWGEQPMLVQAQHYASPDYSVTSLDVLYQRAPQHIGGCLWHSFDHQRGYHPDPFYGGLMDAFRQPKYSYYMFMAQRDHKKDEKQIAQTGAMVYIAHEMTPFSSRDVTVYSNCDEVRLTFNQGGETRIYKRENNRKGMPSPIIVFEDVYDFMQDKIRSRANRQDEVFLLAEGLIDGKVVATHCVRPARRPEQIILWLDHEDVALKADGSDLVTVVAAIADKNGRIKRLNNASIRFEIQGEGRIIGDGVIQANPVPVKWGTAPILVQSTLKSGKIRIRASVAFDGKQVPLSGSLEFESTPVDHPLLYDEDEAQELGVYTHQRAVRDADREDLEANVQSLRKQLNDLKLKEVERQQTDFGE